MIYKGKDYAWVNEVLIAGTRYTMWRGIVDPTDLIIGELTNKKEKVNELKDKKAKDEWKKIKDKKLNKAVK